MKKLLIAQMKKVQEKWQSDFHSPEVSPFSSIPYFFYSRKKVEKKGQHYTTRLKCLYTKEFQACSLTT